MSTTLDYHLLELELAGNPDDPRHCLPEISPAERDVLDIGCGIGQFFAARARGRNDLHAVGLDIEHEPLAYGARRFPEIGYVRGSGDALPFAARSFDLVVSRVSLPYTHLPRALDEIGRVLRPGGRVWLSLHPVSRPWRELGEALRRRQPKDVIFRGYVLANGALLHGCGRLLPFPGHGRYESFQTAGGMRRLLQARGFTNITVQRDRHFVVAAGKPA